MDSSFPTHAAVDLPDWIDTDLRLADSYPDAASQMGLAIELSRLNVERGTGGPFGAAVFDTETGELIALGVNRVQPLCNATAHAEIMAIILAGKKLGVARLSEARPRITLAASGQPCAMCYGALPWAGIHRLLVGARKEDVEQIAGFDEGPLPDDWQRGLESRGIEVITDVSRAAAIDVLSLFAERSGPRY